MFIIKCSFTLESTPLFHVVLVITLWTPCKNMLTSWSFYKPLYGRRLGHVSAPLCACQMCMSGWIISPTKSTKLPWHTLLLYYRSHHSYDTACKWERWRKHRWAMRRTSPVIGVIIKEHSLFPHQDVLQLTERFDIKLFAESHSIFCIFQYVVLDVWIYYFFVAS